jgi:hypothetical protein
MRFIAMTRTSLMNLASVYAVRLSPAEVSC